MDKKTALPLIEAAKIALERGPVCCVNTEDANWHSEDCYKRELRAAIAAHEITEAEEERRGLRLAQAVGLKARTSDEYSGARYVLREGWGTKTALGLYRTAASIIEGA